MNTLLVNAGGIALMALVVWWFWLWRPRQLAHAQEGAIDITVAGGVYDPDYIEVKRGDKLVLRFHREDPSPCAAQVEFHGLGINEALPVGKTKTIELTPEQAGLFRFTCQMQMYQGKLRVVD